MQRLIERLASLLRGAGARAAGARAEAERGVALAWHAGDLQRAIALGARALARWPESADLHFMSGACLLEAGRPDEALAALREARRLARAYPLELLCELHLALALVRAGRERYELQPVDTTRTGALTSIVICSAEDARFERAAADFRAHFAAVPHEIVRIADARSLAEGYNRGMRRARGERLVFTHDDARIVTPDFAQRLDRHFAEADLIGIAGTRRLSGAAWPAAGWPHLAGQVAMEAAAPERLNVTAYGSAALLAPRIQALDGVFMAARREVAEKLGFDAAVFDGWHLYDIDFSFRAWLQGVRVAAAGDLMLVHASSGGYRCGEWELYARRFREKFAAHAATSEPSIQPEICSILVRSAAEWRALTAARLALASGTPVQPPR